MTSELFQDWIKDFDRQMRLSNRKVILLVDNAASHNQGDLILRNVKLHFLPPNTTAHIQPMDAGIIKAFKAHYRRQLVAHYIDCAEKNKEQTVDLRQALHMVKMAWDCVSTKTITNCYRHVQILPEAEDAQFDEDDLPLSHLRRQNEDEEDDDDVPLLQLMQQMRQLPSATDMTAEKYVNIDAEEETGHHLTDDDILMLVSREEEVPDCNSDEDKEEEEARDITIAEAKQCIQTLISYFEQKTTTT
ncbi:tigger transposable element-derived protein 6-like [Saccostrea echinata]|uniref:tigger transposable element-derived protein 6-like n=1 Tax=Saccostrea echinata TaxID=191078 RepID=UPI002A7F1113|nr:tigger transposable element-derived protein 6-like [Saccostrea echinata]